MKAASCIQPDCGGGGLFTLFLMSGVRRLGWWGIKSREFKNKVHLTKSRATSTTMKPATLKTAGDQELRLLRVTAVSAEGHGWSSVTGLGAGIMHPNHSSSHTSVQACLQQRGPARAKAQAFPTDSAGISACVIQISTLLAWKCASHYPNQQRELWSLVTWAGWAKR